MRLLPVFLLVQMEKNWHLEVKMILLLFGILRAL
uniref:Uncharacterized protein n=1 Tax=Arcella intermedia TaxID=1963864 RepID=A0A6B2LY89_9EUKA